MKSDGVAGNEGFLRETIINIATYIHSIGACCLHVHMSMYNISIVFIVIHNEAYSI